MGKIVILVLSTLLAISAGMRIADDRLNLNIPNSFEYLGNADGKIFLKAILPEEHRHGVTWTKAIQICNDAGYRLALIESQAHEDVVARWTTGGGYTADRWVWIDGTNFITASSGNGTFFSISTGRELGFFNFADGRPVRGETKPRCLRWSHSSLLSGWLDISCDDNYNVLCETTFE